MSGLLRYKTVEMFNIELNCICYGLVAEKFENENWIAVAVIKDISGDKKFVTDLAQNCSLGQLDPIHMLDVVLDAIS